MGLNIIRTGSTQGKRKSWKELQQESEELRARVEALESQADASADQVLAVLLGEVSENG